MGRNITVQVRMERRIQVRRRQSIWMTISQPRPSLPRQSGKTVEMRYRPSPAIVALIKEGYGPLVKEGRKHAPFFERLKSESGGFALLTHKERDYDLFLSYANEDKEYAFALAYSLKSRGVKVWFAEWELEVGDSLRQSIDDGILRSRFGGVILSRAFFGNSWTNYELDGLLTLEMQGRKIVLPVLHPDFTIDELAVLSPSMAGKKVLLGSEQGVDTIAETLAGLILR